MITFKVADPYDIQFLEPLFTENAMAFDAVALAAFIAEPTYQLYIAIDGDEVVGYAYGYIQLHPDGKVMQNIYSIFITKSHRKRGLATDFLDFILGDAAAIGCDQSWVMADPLNGAVRRLFKKFEHDSSDQRVFTINHQTG